MSKYLKIGLPLLVIISVITWFVSADSVMAVHSYGNLNGEYDKIEVALDSGSFDLILEDFAQYSKDNPEAALCIRSNKDWQQIALWGEYLAHPRWKLPKCNS